MIKPTVGRVVLYKPKYGELSWAHDQPFRADVCYVWSDICVNLSVNAENGKQFCRDNVVLAQDRDPLPGECYWMDYQKHQAAKVAEPLPKILTNDELETAMDAREFPRVTEATIRRSIVAEDYFDHGTLTICILTLLNGFKIVGESACVDPKNYDASIGRTYARKNAEQQIWKLEGYALANHKLSNTAKATQIK